MHTRVLATVVRPANAAMSRRRSLLTLVGAMAAPGLLAMPAVRARKGNDKTKDKGKDKANKKCQQQGQQCLVVITAICEGDQECIDGGLRCCDLLGRCQAAPGLACLAGAG